MLILLRRFLVLAALFFWQGGFVFYASVVVPIGQKVLATPPTQGFITRTVAGYLNLAGGIALVPMLADIVLPRDGNRLRKWLRLLTWAGLAFTVAMLFWLHPRVEAFLDLENHIIADNRGFRPWHRLYLWTCTIQWAMGVFYMALMLWAWRCEDRHDPLVIGGRGK
jgi:hypothetical protein